MNEELFLKYVKEFNFQEKYKKICDKCIGLKADKSLELNQLINIMNEMPIDFKYKKRDKYFEHIEKNELIEHTFNVEISHYYINLILRSRTKIILPF